MTDPFSTSQFFSVQSAARAEDNNPVETQESLDAVIHQAGSARAALVPRRPGTRVKELGVGEQTPPYSVYRNTILAGARHPLQGMSLSKRSLSLSFVGTRLRWRFAPTRRAGNSAGP
jgi:pyruvate dehydrogenase complex dehydrogenase (E1) component